MRIARGRVSVREIEKRVVGFLIVETTQLTCSAGQELNGMIRAEWLY